MTIIEAISQTYDELIAPFRDLTCMGVSTGLDIEKTIFNRVCQLLNITDKKIIVDCFMMNYQEVFRLKNGKEGEWFI